jgi:glycosyltransferase involved in cell wall biosynthesis
MAARLGRVLRIIRVRGPVGLLAVVLRRVLDRLERRGVSTPFELRMLVRWEDAKAVDWTKTTPWQTEPRAVVSESLSTAWIMHPPGESSGGHQNIFRFIEYLEGAGHRATVYLYDSRDRAVDPVRVQQMIAASRSYPHVAAQFRIWEGATAPDTDVIVATGWETAYPAFLDPSHAPRAYFVQDFEPAFYAVGSEHTFAENTYRFGFRGITAGNWLATKLARDYGMRTVAFDFGANTDIYHPTGASRRDEVFFYARPVTLRRGFEMGVMALEKLVELRPDVTIHLAGWDVSGYDLTFPHVHHAAMKIDQLNDLYNRCGVGLVLSMTNLSLLPLELLAAGVIPVLNEGENNRLVTDNPFIVYSEPSPAALARAMNEVLERPDLAEHAQAASRSVGRDGWDGSGARFVAALEDVARG